MHKSMRVILLKKRKKQRHFEYNRWVKNFTDVSFRMKKIDKKKEQRDLLKKLQDANEQISNLQIKLNEAEEDAESKSGKVSFLDTS